MSNIPVADGKYESPQIESWQYEHYILSGVLKMQLSISIKSSKHQLIVNLILHFFLDTSAVLISTVHQCRVL